MYEDVDKIIEQLIEICEKHNLSPDTIIIMIGIVLKKKVSHIIKDYDKLQSELHSHGINFIKSESGINLTISENNSLVSDIKEISYGNTHVENKSKQVTNNFIVTKELFNELFYLYPHKVEGLGTQRILRSNSDDTQLYDKCFRKYKSKINTFEEHKKVISGTENYINITDHRYLKNFDTYINQQTWESFIDLTPKKDIYRDY